MRHKILLFIFPLLFSCSSKKKEIKYTIIPEDKFVRLLVNYHLSEGISNSHYFVTKILKIKAINLQDSLLKQYGYNKAIFDSSVAYYSADPEKYDLLYEKAITELSKMLAAEQKAEKKKMNAKPSKPLDNKKLLLKK